MMKRHSVLATGKLHEAVGWIGIALGWSHFGVETSNQVGVVKLDGN